MVACPANQTVKTDASQAYATVVWETPNVTDNAAETPTITCSIEYGSQFEIGEKEVICHAVDLGGNRGACSFTVVVIGKCQLFKPMQYLGFVLLKSTSIDN